MPFRGRIWLDVSGVSPGSDAALFAARLGAALQRQDGVTLTLCRRDPALRVIDWSALDAPSSGPDLHKARIAWWRGLADRIPRDAQMAIGRFVRLQRNALAARRPVPRAVEPVVQHATPPDDAAIAAGDVLMMLAPSGNASRFAANGVRLCFVAVDAIALVRPDWLESEPAAEAAVWLRTTLPHVTRTIAFAPEIARALTGAGCAAWLIDAAACLGASGSDETAFSDCVLAAAPMGEAGSTRHLLLAWRRLLDEMPQGTVPRLVLAGAVGALSGDVLTQLRNSDRLEGCVEAVFYPSPDRMRALLDGCRFCIAAEAHDAWGRATLDSLAAGVPCLSAFPANGAVAVDPTNAAHLADQVRAWLADTPPRPVAQARGWDDVARDVLGPLAA